jgi:hypothetical protein
LTARVPCGRLSGMDMTSYLGVWLLSGLAVYFALYMIGRGD